MKDHDAETERGRRASQAQVPAIQVICLGSGGGPNEDNVTGFLVRSIASGFAKGSILAVDAGSHLAAITRILEKDFPLVSDFPASEQPQHALSEQDVINKGDESEDDGSPTPEPVRSPTTTLQTGPFAGLPFPHASARANAAHVVRDYVSTYLITHPHLDHVSGFVINTAAFHNTSRPKRLAALPFAVNAIKTHIFNDIIWPNLTDEDGGVGFVTFQRLAEGGNIALGEGPSRGFIEVCDGLSTKGFKVSHGHCMRGASHVHRGSLGRVQEQSSGAQTVSQISRASTGMGNMATPDGRENRSMSFSMPSQPGTPLFNPSHTETANPNVCVIDSTAYFIRAEATADATAREVLIFGDVEPDSISLSPRTLKVWTEAAPKIASGTLTGVFIECSYNDSQADQVLFGHVSPRHVIAELQNLAELVKEAKREQEREREEARKGRKRKRQSRDYLSISSPGGVLEDSSNKSSRRASRIAASHGPSNELDEAMHDFAASPIVPKVVPLPPSEQSLVSQLQHSLLAAEPQSLDPAGSTKSTALNIDGPLRGLKVVIIHVKDTLTDGPLVGESILAQLKEHEDVLSEQGKALGCEFAVSKSGESYWF